MKRWIAGILFVGLLVAGVLALSGQFVAGDREIIRIDNPVATALPGTGQFLAVLPKWISRRRQAFCREPVTLPGRPLGKAFELVYLHGCIILRTAKAIAMR